ncbi:MAG: aminoglycoside phosphotransferase family protein [Myxococcota bacterium]
MRHDGMELGSVLREVYGTPDPPGAQARKLAGDASTRIYYRLTVPSPRTGPASAIVMRLPEDALGSDEGPGTEQAPELPFLNVHRLLTARGAPVPAVLARDLDAGVLLLEDLGDETLERRLHDAPEDWDGLYAQAVDVLAELHERCEPGEAGSLAHARRFDRALLRWELDHFREWGLEAVHGPPSASDRAELDGLLDEVADAVAALPCGFVHRDYQSRNLMWRTDGRLAVIDFQDALVGPRAYDLAALLCDSYVPLGLPLQRAMVARYAARRGIAAPDLEGEVWRVAVQRKLKDAGRFVFIDRVRGNPRFLPWYGPSLGYVRRALNQLKSLDIGGPWEPLAALLARNLPGFEGTVAPPASIGSKSEKS